MLLTLQVAAVPEDVGTAGALRAIAHHLTAKDILVSTKSFMVSGFSRISTIVYLQPLVFHLSAGCDW